MLDRSVPVDRDVRWTGKRYVGTELFFIARYTVERPPLLRAGPLPEERASLRAHAWFAWPDLRSLPDPVEPPRLPEPLDTLAPEGPWRRRAPR